jgi:hypothetical protein
VKKKKLRADGVIKNGYLRNVIDGEDWINLEKDRAM